MKVLLVEDVEGLGSTGEVHEVAMGYARNYLLPQELAVVATPGAIKALKAKKKAQARKEARLAEEATELAEQMSQLTLTFEAKAGPTGRLYGSITTADIAEALEKELDTEVDRRKISTDPLREVGEHMVPVRLSRDVEAQVTVVVHAEGVEEESEPSEPAGEIEAGETS